MSDMMLYMLGLEGKKGSLIYVNVVEGFLQLILLIKVANINVTLMILNIYVGIVI